MKPSNAKYIWSDSTGKGHNLYTMFRKSFDLDGSVEEAKLNIFADTHYQLFVNGTFVQYGPVRFDPRFPLYDTHDISGLLRPGRNVIAVLVNSIQHKVFKTIPAGAGLTAWGRITTASVDVDLHTAQGTWKCMASEAYRPAPRLSFALNAGELYDQSLAAEGWKERGFDDSGWPDAVEVKEQDAWGELEPRSIPLMQSKDIPVKSVKVYPIVRRENTWSFSVPTPFMESISEEEHDYYCPNFLWHTWIWSPVDQTVIAGLQGGEVWLNGDRLTGAVSADMYWIRRNQVMNLKVGWNFYFGKGSTGNGVFQHSISLPEGKGLCISAMKDTVSPYWFRRSPLLTMDQYNKYLNDINLPCANDEDLSACGGWVLTEASDRAHSPFFDSCSDLYANPVEVLNPEELEGHVFRKELYPEGFYILMDAGQMRLVFPKVGLNGASGAEIDLIYGEKFTADGRHLRLQPWVPLCDRAVCNNDRVEWLLCHPRGGQYFAMAVRGYKGDVKLDKLELRSAAYPVQTVGAFRCSDQCLNEVWELGRRTQESNMEDAYVDCSGRERGMYGRDTIIQYHNNLALYGDQALMERCMELFGQSPDDTGKFRAVYPNTGDYTIADFALNMLEGYLAYYEQTDDKKLIETCWDAMMGNLRWFHELADEREDLLLDGEWDKKRGIKAAYGGFHGDNAVVDGYMDNTGISCGFSCTYLISMKCALKLAQAIGRMADAQELERRIKIVSESIPALLWDEEKGCFADNEKRTTYSVHASLMAIRAGVVSEDKLDKVRKYVSSSLKSVFVNGYNPQDGVYVSPHFAFYIFDGLYRLGLYAVAENMMRQGWGWMLSEGLATCTEFFSLDNSLCHAWAACPTYYLSRYVLGVSFPDAPDMDRVEIDVRTHDITWAEGKWPHPRGIIEVKWHVVNGQRVFDRISAPKGVEVSIRE